MLKKAIFSIGCLLTTLNLNAQTKGLPSEIITGLSQAPIYQEASLNAPVIHAISMSDTKMQLVNFAFDNSTQKCKDKNSVFANNLFFEVMLFSNNKANENAHGMDTIKGFIPAYYIANDNNFKTALEVIFPSEKIAIQPLTKAEGKKVQKERKKAEKALKKIKK